MVGHYDINPAIYINNKNEALKYKLNHLCKHVNVIRFCLTLSTTFMYVNLTLGKLYLKDNYSILDLYAIIYRISGYN